MQTVAQGLSIVASTLVAGVGDLLGADRPLRDMNNDGSSVVIIGPTHTFEELTLEKKRLQSRLNEEQRYFFAFARALLRIRPDAERQLERWQKTVTEVIDQRHGVWHRTTGKAHAAVEAVVNRVLEAVDHLHDAAEGSVVLVPDTNALIHGADIDAWELDTNDQFEVLLVPLVLSELDGLKMGHREPRIRERAREVIRFLKACRDRGSLTDGVTVVADRSRLRALAVEPRVEATFEWLDASVPDDRMIASVVEVMRHHPRSVVLLVTGDINMQTKAVYAHVPFREIFAPTGA